MPRSVRCPSRDTSPRLVAPVMSPSSNPCVVVPVAAITVLVGAVSHANLAKPSPAKELAVVGGRNQRPRSAVVRRPQNPHAVITVDRVVRLARSHQHDTAIRLYRDRTIHQRSLLICQRTPGYARCRRDRSINRLPNSPSSPRQFRSRADLAGAAGGVWKSINAASSPATGVTWSALTDQQASLVNGAVSVKADGSVVLVGTGEPNNAIDSYYGVGILRSTNHGATWTLIPSANNGNSFAGLGFAKFAWDTSPANTVMAATGTTTQGFGDGDITGATNRGLVSLD